MSTHQTLAIEPTDADRAADNRPEIEAEQSEIVDGAWGDGPFPRGAARDELARIRAKGSAS